MRAPPKRSSVTPVAEILGGRRARQARSSCRRWARGSPTTVCESCSPDWRTRPVWWPGERCRPRLHHFRHRFAVETLLSWYRSGEDVAARLPLLSTFLGHVKPASTYWYLSATPELLALAAERLEPLEVAR